MKKGWTSFSLFLFPNENKNNEKEVVKLSIISTPILFLYSS